MNAIAPPKRVYSPYQTQFQTAEEVACAMRDWIDQHFDPKLKRTPVIAKAQKNEKGSNTRGWAESGQR